jgi:hypothetical protein
MAGSVTPTWLKKGDSGFEHQKVESVEIVEFGAKLSASSGAVEQAITHNNGMEIIEIAITIRRQ